MESSWVPKKICLTRGVSHYDVMRRIFKTSAILTRFVKDFVAIFRMTLLRGVSTVPALIPNSAAICLFLSQQHQSHNFLFALRESLKFDTQIGNSLFALLSDPLDRMLSLHLCMPVGGVTGIANHQTVWTWFASRSAMQPAAAPKGAPLLTKRSFASVARLMSFASVARLIVSKNLVSAHDDQIRKNGTYPRLSGFLWIGPRMNPERKDDANKEYFYGEHGRTAGEPCYCLCAECPARGTRFSRRRSTKCYAKSRRLVPAGTTPAARRER